MNEGAGPCESEGVNTLQPHEVRAQVDRIAASTFFSESDRLRRFLVFATEASLSGDAASLKEYVLGREVFDRGGDYDPRLDPIVRVEARRLRSKLTGYYEGPGVADEVRIEFEKGSYVPLFRRVKVSGAKSRWQSPAIVAATVAALVAGAVFLRDDTPAQTGMIAVLPAQWVYADHDDTNPAAVPLSEALTIELANRNLARVVAWPIVSHDPNPAPALHDIAARLGASRVLVVIVRDEEGGNAITLFDIDAKTGRKRGALRYRTPVVSAIEQEKLAQRMASDLALSLQSAHK